MRALILNDTRRGSFARHLGCEAVMTHLLALCRAYGVEVVRAFERVDAVDTEEFGALLPQVDAVIVNGEGTMHHDSASAVALARAIVAAKFAGKKTALLNAVWQGNDVVNECLAALDFVSVRDSFSAREVHAAGREDVVTAADFSLWREARKVGRGVPAEPSRPVGGPEPVCGPRLGEDASPYRKNLIVVDSVDEAEALRLKKFAEANGLPFRVMQDWRVREGSGKHPLAGCALLTADDLAMASLVVSGRFHAVCLALKQRTPFLAVSSNTHKVEALLHDAGLLAADFVLPAGWQERPAEFWREQAMAAWARTAARAEAFAIEASASIDRAFAAMAEKIGAGPAVRVEVAPARVARRKVRVCYFNTWAQGLEDAATYVGRAPGMDLAPLVANPRDAALMKKARLDCDWYAENARCFASMAHEAIEFLPAWVSGQAGLADLVSRPRESGEERWLVTMGHQPQALGAGAGKVFSLLSRLGVKHLFYAFDEASRFMPCFGDIAPVLDVVIHDEAPLEEKNRAKLKAGCRTIHRSWVANVLPGAVPFNQAPEEKILFLGSQLGLTAHRQRQIDFLKKRFREKFVPSVDHSVAVAARDGLRRFKVGLCPEGRKFTTPAMAKTHTDRPFWSGCLGMVPVSEDSKSGGRLQELHEAGLILRYAHGDLEALAAQCERALAIPNDERRRIYEHFNARETVGVVVAEAIAASG